MPELPICNADGSLSRDAGLQILAHMYYPQDERRRRDYLNACAFLNAEQDETFLERYDGGFYPLHTDNARNLFAYFAAIARRSLPHREDYYKTAGGRRVTANLPKGPAKLIDEAADGARYPQLAGEVLLALLAQSPVAGLGIPSVHMAARLIDAWEKRKGQGSKSIEKSWQQCRLAAHLWAAAWQDSSENLLGSLFPHRKLPQFLATAEAYRRAVNALPRRVNAEEPLPDRTAWSPPQALALPAVEIRVPPLPDNWFGLLEDAGYRRLRKRLSPNLTIEIGGRPDRG